MTDIPPIHVLRETRLAQVSSMLEAVTSRHRESLRATKNAH